MKDYDSSIVAPESVFIKSEYPVYNEKEKIGSPLGFRCNFYYSYYYTPDEKVFRLHSHNYYELIFFPEEGCLHYINDTVQILPKGALLFIRPDDIHDLYNTSGKKIPVIHIAVNSDIMNGMFDFLTEEFPSKQLISSKTSMFAVLNSLETTDFIFRYNSINNINPRDEVQKSFFFRSLLIHTFVQFFSNIDILSKTPPKIPAWLTFSRNEMLKQENFSLGIDRMCQLCNCSKEHLCRTFKKFYGITPMDYINDIRITYISNMLINSNETFTNICYDCGFNTINWAYKLFKEKYGVTPLKYRKQIQPSTFL